MSKFNPTDTRIRIACKKYVLQKLCTKQTVNWQNIWNEDRDFQVQNLLDPVRIQEK